jgi:two-component system sensor histidine kinase DegS
MVFKEVEQSENNWDAFIEEIQTELEQTRREIDETGLMIEQSQLEVGKLARRNSSVTAHLQQLQDQFNTAPRDDIRVAYDAALESQQRLFVMRGQLEKLQSDQTQLQRYLALLERVQQPFKSGVDGTIGSYGVGSTSTVEKLETVMQAQEDERRRLSRQIHDGPAQALSNFILQTEIAIRLFDIDQEKARQELLNLKMSATSTFQQLREFIAELRPMMLDDLGLVPTLKRYVESYAKTAGAEMRLTVSGTKQRLEPYQEVMIFRAVQELLANATRHGHASQVNIQLDISEQIVKVSVEDNGNGFDLVKLEEHKGVGLNAIKNRVEMSGGKIDLDSAIGQGTRIHFRIPVIKAARPA